MGRPSLLARDAYGAVSLARAVAARWGKVGVFGLQMRRELADSAAARDGAENNWSRYSRSLAQANCASTGPAVCRSMPAGWRQSATRKATERQQIASKAQPQAQTQTHTHTQTVCAPRAQDSRSSCPMLWWQPRAGCHRGSAFGSRRQAAMGHLPCAREANEGGVLVWSRVSPGAMRTRAHAPLPAHERSLFARLQALC